MIRVHAREGHQPFHSIETVHSVFFLLHPTVLSKTSDIAMAILFGSEKISIQG